MEKTVKAVKPYIYKNNSNFKLAVYNAWVEAGGKHVSERPYEHLYESLSYHLPLPISTLMWIFCATSGSLMVCWFQTGRNYGRDDE